MTKENPESTGPAAKPARHALVWRSRAERRALWKRSRQAKIFRRADQSRLAFTQAWRATWCSSYLLSDAASRGLPPISSDGALRTLKAPASRHPPRHAYGPLKAYLAKPDGTPVAPGSDQ